MKRHSWTIGLIAATALTLAGCSNSEDDAPSGGDQAATAEAMLDCLTEASVPAALESLPNGQQSIVFNDARAYEYSLGGFATGGGGASTGAEGDVEALMAKNRELVAKYTGTVVEPDPATPPPANPGTPKEPTSDPDPSASEDPDEPLNPPYLVVDGVDYSPAWQRCLTQSAYTEPVMVTGPDQELEQKQIIFKGTLNWAKCARLHGYPDLADPLPAKVDGFDTYPTAVLPVDTTPAELRALLAECPAFDVQAAEAQAEAVQALGEHPDAKLLEQTLQDYPIPVINIGFDSPGWDGTSSLADTENESWDHLLELDAIITENQQSLVQLPDGSATGAGGQ